MNPIKARFTQLLKRENRPQPANLYRGTAIALVPLFILTILCAAIFGGPQTRERSLQDWATSSPTDFVLTAAKELAGSEGKGSNGPPYNLLSKGESLGPLDLQWHGGLGNAVDPANDFVIQPLQQSQQMSAYVEISTLKGLSIEAQTQLLMKYVRGQKNSIGAGISEWSQADSKQQIKWANTYISVLESANSRAHITNDPSFGPVKTLTDALLFIAETGVLDSILTTEYSPYPSDFTKPALFLGDGHYISEQAHAEFLDGQKMAVASGTNSYPGQFWLTPYAMWYSIKPLSTSKNADIEVFAILLIISLLTLYFPKIPIINKLPRLLPFQRLREED